MLRTFALQVEALQRYRGKGQQKVTVEHVHVHAGGQAIVGAITPGGRGKEKSDEQAHAPSEITHEPRTPVKANKMTKQIARTAALCALAGCAVPMQTVDASRGVYPNTARNAGRSGMGRQFSYRRLFTATD